MSFFWRRIVYFGILFLSNDLFLFSQEEFATSTSFHTITPEYFNPAFTGERRVLSASALYYAPYIGLKDAPTMQLIAINSPVRRFSPVALGGIVVRSPLSYVQYNRFFADFSYSVNLGQQRYFSENRIYFGFRFGITNYNVFTKNGRYYSAADPFISSTADNQPATGFGVAYKVTTRKRGAHYRTGLSVPFIVKAEGKIYTTVTFMLSGNIPVARKMVVSPSLLVRSTTSDEMRFSFNTFFSITNYTLITGYDDGVLLSGLGMLISPQMYVGAAYRFFQSNQNISSNAGIEVSMRYEMFGRRNLSMKYNYANGGMFRTY